MFMVIFGPPIGLFPLIFLIIGIGILAIPTVAIYKEKQTRSHGKRYAAKVFGYVEDTTITVNGAYPINIKVRFFDDKHNVSETTIATRFPKGNVPYPIGATVDIYGLNGIYAVDPESVTSAKIPGEDQLMDNRPLEPEKTDYVAITCPNCGATYQAIKGYTGKCPYCDTYTNAE